MIARKIELYLVVSTEAKIDRSKFIKTIDTVFVRDLQKILSSYGNQASLSDFDKILLKNLPGLVWKIYTPKEFLEKPEPGFQIPSSK